MNKEFPKAEREEMAALCMDCFKERESQIAKHGNNEYPDGICPNSVLALMEIAKRECDRLMTQGKLPSWQAVMNEEAFEVLAAESDEERLKELKQLATVCLAWGAKISLRMKAKNKPCEEK